MFKKITLIGMLILAGCSQQISTNTTDVSTPKAVNPDPNHTHADFAIFIDGKQLDFSDPEYMADLPTEIDHSDHGHTHDTLHLHDEVATVIHRHKPGQSFGEFLNSIGIQLTTSCITLADQTQFCTNNENILTMVINNAHMPVDPNYVFVDEDQILLTYNKVNSNWVDEWNQLTDDSCLYSKTCPERGEPPVENCIADPEVPCLAPLE